MKFSCGENREHKHKRLKSWHDCFIFWPRTVAVIGDRDICAWLETVERKGAWFGEYGGWLWAYRAKK